MNKNQVEKINKKERYTGFFLTKISKNPCVTAFFCAIFEFDK